MRLVVNKLRIREVPRICEYMSLFALQKWLKSLSNGTRVGRTRVFQNKFRQPVVLTRNIFILLLFCQSLKPSLCEINVQTSVPCF
jgi:hypothetical protein